MPKLIEEDIRYTTAVDLMYGFTEEDYLSRPTMPGYDFTMLLDQLDGHVLSHVSHSPKILIVATCGTAYWIAKHVQETNTQWDYTSALIYKNKPKALIDIYLDPNFSSTKIVSELSVLSCVRSINKATKPKFFDFDLVLLCPVKGVDQTYNSFKPIVSNIPVLAYDPNKQLKSEGKHFLNSCIWVKI
jgi:hypothetical protein